LSNSKKWKRITPLSFQSPFIAQGDLGFFYYNGKEYGQFFCAINTFTKRLFCIPIKNTKSESLMKAIELMKKEKSFRYIHTLLFDGESGLRSKKIQNIILEKFNLTIHAESHYKRNLAERMVREIKLRTSILLNLKGQSLKQWKNVLPHVVNIINYHQEKKFKSKNQMLTAYFTSNTEMIPQSNKRFYKFDINDKVKIEMTPVQRKQLGFKYSLNRGKLNNKK